MPKENNNIETEKEQEELPEVEQELSQVATNPKQSLIIMLGIAAIFSYLVFNLFFDSEDAPDEPAQIPVPENVVKPVQISSDNLVPTIPNLPPPPQLEDPTLPPPPPPAPPEEVASLPPPPPIIEEEEKPAPLPLDTPQTVAPIISSPALPFDLRSRGEESKRRLEQKRKSSIILIAGTPPRKTQEQIQQEADFSFRGDMNLVLGRGKMIDAIIESAVNSDFGGEIRAIISRDVYSEWGKNILIPKGSRIFGFYSTGIRGAYGRVNVDWRRIDLASGYSINFRSSGTDNLGRKGSQGRVDNKFKERFGNTILRSAFNIALAGVLDKIVEPVTNSETSANLLAEATAAANSANTIFTQTGIDATQKFAQICSTVPIAITDKASALYVSINAACTAAPGDSSPEQRLTSLMNSITTASNSAAQTSTTNSTPSQAQEASTQAFEDISALTRELLNQQNFDPTVTLDQGTPIKIYVNKDYKFPKEVLMKRIIK